MNVLVGPNNAGKSSTLDALRLVSDVSRQLRQGSPFLRDQENHGVCATYQLPVRGLSIPISNVVRNYGDDHARIEYHLSNGNKLHLKLHPDHGCFAFVTGTKHAPRTSGAFRTALDLDVVVVPTLSALEEDEQYVQDETARRNENSRLASRNFRNIVMRQSDDEFERFRYLCQQAWPEIELAKPTTVPGKPPRVYMMYSEARIEREVYWSGFGFQVWMQMMLQFQRAKSGSILVLDEPDIYLHPDLQRRLLRLSSDMFGQVFLATHSTEIINEADAGEILSIDSKGRSGRRISTDDDYRRIYSYLGSSENAEFSRLAKAERIVFFEGKDRNMIRKFAKKLKLDDLLDDPRTLYLQAGGFAQWRRIPEVSWAMRDIFGLTAKIAAIFDRDYRCDGDVEDFEGRLTSDDLWVSVLRRKEIENYALSTASLVRTLRSRLSSRGFEFSDDQAKALLDATAEQFEADCRAQRCALYLAHAKATRKGVDDATALKEANEEFNTLWGSLEGRLKVVGGKEYVSSLSAFLQKDYGTSLTIPQLIEEITADEIDPELGEKLSDMANFFRAS